MLLSLLHMQPCFCNCKEARRGLQSSYPAAATAAGCSMSHTARAGQLINIDRPSPVISSGSEGGGA